MSFPDTPQVVGSGLSPSGCASPTPGAWSPRFQATRTNRLPVLGVNLSTSATGSIVPWPVEDRQLVFDTRLIPQASSDRLRFGRDGRGADGGAPVTDQPEMHTVDTNPHVNGDPANAANSLTINRPESLIGEPSEGKPSTSTQADTGAATVAPPEGEDVTARPASGQPERGSSTECVLETAGSQKQDVRNVTGGDPPEFCPAGPSRVTPQQQPQGVMNLNVRAAFIHVLGDLIQSVGVLFAAIIIYFCVSATYPPLSKKQKQVWAR